MSATDDGGPRDGNQRVLLARTADAVEPPAGAEVQLELHALAREEHGYDSDSSDGMSAVLGHGLGSQGPEQPAHGTLLRRTDSVASDDSQASFYSQHTVQEPVLRRKYATDLFRTSRFRCAAAARSAAGRMRRWLTLSDGGALADTPYYKRVLVGAGVVVLLIVLFALSAVFVNVAQPGENFPSLSSALSSSWPSATSLPTAPPSLGRFR